MIRLLRRAALEHYGIDLPESELDAAQLRSLAHQLNESRSREGGAEPVRAGELNALLLLQELLSAKLTRSLETAPDAERSLGEQLRDRLGEETVQEVLGELEREFDHRPDELGPLALSPLLVLYVLNRNPALDSLRELFDDRQLESSSHYLQLIEAIGAKTEDSAQTAPEPWAQWARQPEAVTPESALNRQLTFILTQWPELDESEQLATLKALDLLAEERPRPAPGPGPLELPSLEGLAPPPPQPSSEAEWMRHLVLGAKHTRVWLYQLSEQAGRPLERLSEVPDQELDRLAALGLTGLWLIGVWQRSPASARIKELSGSRTPEASAYSVFDYRIDQGLGGDEAIEDLQERALARGIRLGVDVVPNHMGVDSQWLRDHPERFLSIDRSPFPGYTFDGPDLSGDPDVGIFLEDHYYDRSDAAVVFKRVDRRTGEERFVYHGNDGTSTPWNDTAQLDYLQPAVREAMTSKILEVARRFPILRFDAAMTLTRQHYRRLWFPAPGTGGDIPSRSEHGLDDQAFDRAMPAEFWSDVVDRAASEAPDCLLLAEAFWLLEAFFVRDLRMHRVYNSAFMHLMREQDNHKMQTLLRDTWKVDPEILRRYVNFMSNPDERSAADQFGRGDRYFGVATLMATLPGLPLFGHGQIEGLYEQYGMEFSRPRLAEQPVPELIQRHLDQIQPLLARRDVFCDAARFLPLDLEDSAGHNPFDVIAFLNGDREELTVVLFNNATAPIEMRFAPSAMRALRGRIAERWKPGDTIRFTDRVDRRRHLASAERIELKVGPWQSMVLTGFERIER